MISGSSQFSEGAHDTAPDTGGVTLVITADTPAAPPAAAPGAPVPAAEAVAPAIIVGPAPTVGGDAGHSTQPVRLADWVALGSLPEPEGAGGVFVDVEDGDPLGALDEVALDIAIL